MTLRYICERCFPPCRLLEESDEPHEAPERCPYLGFEFKAVWRFDE